MTKSNSRGDLRRNQRGQALILFALGLTFLIGIAGLAIEGGLLQADRRFDQAISDGAALAGAHKLPSVDTTPALTQAAHYAVAALNGGQIPSDCNAVMATLAVDTTPPALGVPLPTACDPSPTHTLLIHTPYNLRPDQILVRLDHKITLNLAAVVGAGPGSTASRSVAQSFSAGTPFGFGLYVRGNLHVIGNTGTNETTVHGNVYVRGCIENNNQDHVIVMPSTDGTQVGSVEVYGDSSVPGVGTMPQVWTSGAGSGCNAFVDGSTGPSQWGASGHASRACAPKSTGLGTAGFSTDVCPAGEVPLIGFPTFTPHDSTGCPNAPPGTFTTTGGCYSACAAGGGNVIIPDGTVFSPGTYAFVGNGAAGGCDVMFAGSASVAQTLAGDGFGGVTFYLYNGASMCSGKTDCAHSDASGTVTLNAPNVPSPDDKNFGILVYSCNGTCGNASGDFDFKSPHVDVSLTGTVYNPAGDCIVFANGGTGVVGQLVCDNVTLQGGTVGGGLSVNGNKGVEATPNFLAQLIE